MKKKIKQLAQRRLVAHVFTQDEFDATEYALIDINEKGVKQIIKAAKQLSLPKQKGELELDELSFYLNGNFHLEFFEGDPTYDKNINQEIRFGVIFTEKEIEKDSRFKRNEAVESECERVVMYKLCDDVTIKFTGSTYGNSDEYRTESFTLDYLKTIFNGGKRRK